MFQEFKIDELESFPKRLDELLNRQRVVIDSIAGKASNGFQDTLKILQDLDEELNLFFTPLSHMNSVMNSELTQRAYEECIPLLSKFSSEMSHNIKLYEKLKTVIVTNEEQKMVLSNEIRDFKLSGAELNKNDKKRLEIISLELSELSNKFSQNLLDATNDYELILEEKDVKGVPESDLNAAREERDSVDVYKFSLQMPSYISYMTYGANRSIRAKLSKAYSSRAPQNEDIINRILFLRSEKSKLLSFDNYAEYALEDRDANSKEEVLSFLNTLADRALPVATKELNELKEFANSIDGIKDFHSYDIAYYTEKLKKEKFDFDDTETKPYFQSDIVLSGLLDVISELFDVSFKKIDVKTWHKSVKCYDIYDANQKVFSRIYFDLEARKEKRGGAWMSDWESHFEDSSKEKHLASAFVVCNFAESSASVPSLLRHDDVVTLFHEMGHAIHHLFSSCQERSISGINGVAWDVIEFPSQFLENFAYEMSIIERLAFHYETNAAMPKVLMNKIKESKNFQVGLGIMRQIEFSLFDLTLHAKLYQGKEIQLLLDGIRVKTALIKVDKENKFQHGFAHIFSGGYAAGYYSYKWAEILSADAFFDCVDEDGNFDKNKTNGYKDNILKKGASKKMRDLYFDWLNKKPSVESLLRLYELK